MNENYEELKIKFNGPGNPTPDELIDILKSVKETIPKEARNDFYIKGVQNGSVEITAVITEITDIFMNPNYDLYWAVLAKILSVCTLIGVDLNVVNVIKKIKRKRNATESDVSELLKYINDDPNALRHITHQDFKDYKKIAEIVKKRKHGVVFQMRDHEVHLNEEGAKTLNLIAGAIGEEDIKDVEEQRLTLKISRVSFYGNEKWKAKIIGSFQRFNDKMQYIDIEDEELRLSIAQNKLYFSGKEVIDADVRIETINGKSNFYLVKFYDILNISALGSKQRR